MSFPSGRFQFFRISEFFLVSEKVCSGKMEQSPRSLLAEHDAEATCISFELNASKGSMVLEYSNHRDGDEIYFGVSATDGADFPSVEVQSNGYRVRLPTSETAEIVKIAAFAAAPIGFVLFRPGCRRPRTSYGRGGRVG